MITKLYADGGVIEKNPSTIGGTWACILVNEAEVQVSFGTGVITPNRARVKAVTNNLTELLALIEGLERVPIDFSGTVLSDSNVSLDVCFAAGSGITFRSGRANSTRRHANACSTGKRSNSCCWMGIRPGPSWRPVLESAVIRSASTTSSATSSAAKQPKTIYADSRRASQPRGPTCPSCTRS